jgi:hypothetical protein
MPLMMSSLCTASSEIVEPDASDENARDLGLAHVWGHVGDDLRAMLVAAAVVLVEGVAVTVAIEGWRGRWRPWCRR